MIPSLFVSILYSGYDNSTVIAVIMTVKQKDWEVG